MVAAVTVQWQLLKLLCLRILRKASALSTETVELLLEPNFCAGMETMLSLPSTWCTIRIVYYTYIQHMYPLPGRPGTPSDPSWPGGPGTPASPLSPLGPILP